MLMNIIYILCYSYPLLYQLTQKDISSPLPGTEGLLHAKVGIVLLTLSAVALLFSSSPVELFWHWNHYQKYHK